jgi:mono/diheme cytochrome c family protein
VSFGTFTIWRRWDNRKRNRASPQMNRFLKGILKCSVFFLALALFLIPIGVTRGAFQRKSASRAKQVDELFARNCARCHGADGSGDTPLGHLYKAPDFTDSDWWKKNSSISSRRNLRSIITRGRAGMPAFGKKLTGAEINLLIRRVRRFRQTS